MGERVATGDPGAGLGRYLTFLVGEELYALPADEVTEVVRVPEMARVPQAPRGLLGLGNLRGSVLPFASARALLNRPAAAPGRAIILAGPSPVGLAVDRVEALVSIDAGALQAGEADLAGEPGEPLRGAFQVAGRQEIVKVLDVWPLLEAAFRPAAAAEPRRSVGGVGAQAASGADQDATAVRRLVTFEAAGQEFALPLEELQEIVQLPATVAAVPRTESLVLGVSAYRQMLLPLLSLRGLLGLAPATEATGREKVLVIRVGHALAGLVVDAMREIVPAAPELVEPTPPMLLARAGGESRIAEIYRGDGGRRLISLLSRDLLFREDVMQRLRQARPGEDAVLERNDEASETRQFVVFRLGEDEFALPIEAVEEVARAPDQVTRVPKTPKFLEGVMNLRGEVLPVVDQRRRFDMPPAPAPDARRLLVVRTERHRAGLIVDSVSEVLRSTPQAIEPAPQLAGEAERLVEGVINLPHSGRLVLLLNPAELLTRAERGLLDAFQADARQARP